MAAIYVPPSSAQVVYSSTVGVVAGGANSTGASNSAAIQAILDAYGSAGTPLEFVFDQPGVTVIDVIRVWGGQTLRGLPGTTIQKMGTSGNTVSPLIWNKHPVAYGSGSQTDQNIILRDLWIDGNRRGGGSGGNGAYPFTGNIGGVDYPIPSVLLGGVNGLYIENCHIIDSPSYGFQLGYVTNGTIVGASRFLWPSDTETAGAGDSVFQFQGGCSNVHAFGCYGSSGDDTWAFNANDGNDVSGTPTFGNSFAQGPITHCSVNDSYFLPNLNGTFGSPGRLLSSNPSSYIDGITYNNVTAWCRFSPFTLDNFGIPMGKGSYDNIRFVNCTYYVDGSVPALRIGAATVGDIRFDATIIPMSGITATDLVDFTSNSSVESAEISIRLRDPSGYFSGPIASLAGACNRLFANTWKIYRGSSSTLAQPAISSTGTNALIQVLGGSFDRISNVVKVSAGTTTTVMMGGVSHTNAGGGASAAQSGGTASRLRYSGMDTALLKSGTWGTTQGDTSQDS
jgi:hypothetical protein